MKDLSQKALLANLTIRQWSAHKYDKKVSEEIEQQHNTRNAGRFNKILIAEKELKEIQKVSGNARRFLYNNTLPWGDNGDRLLPAANYFDFVSKFRVYKDEFEDAVKKFVTEYPDLKDEAQRRLNGMFRESDYPSISLIKAKFDIAISFMPISDTTDFRLEVDAEEVQNLRNQIEQEVSSRIMQTTKHIWGRIKETVGHMVERLSDEKAVFQNSLIENIQELIDVLPRLNFTNDYDINNVIESMKSLLVKPDHLRKDKDLRNEKAQEAQAILNKVSDFLA